MAKVLETVLTWDSFRELILSNQFTTMGIDTETSGQNPKQGLDIRDGRAYSMGMSLALRMGDTDSYFTCYLPRRHSYPVDVNLPMETWVDIATVVEGFPGAFIFHNAKFDLVSLRGFGIYLNHNRWFDTMLMCHLINENYPYSKDLSTCIRVYVDKEESKKDDDVFKLWIKRYGWAGIPIAVMTPYATHDAAITLALYYAIVDAFWTEVTPEYWEHKKNFLWTILKMESRGVRVDTELCEERAAVGTDILGKLTANVGGNIGSPIFLKELLIDRLELPIVKTSLKTGKPSFDKEVMAEYDDILSGLDNPLAQDILKYRGWQKVVSTNYRPYVDLLSPDGRLRPNYKLHGTRTGRISCEIPNLQNIPRSSEKPWNGTLKKAFIPMDGYVLIGFDYAQLEFRLATAYAREPTLLKYFEEDRDIFSEMAIELGLPRWDTKQGVYATQYGAGVTKLGRMLGDYYKAERFHDNYQASYPNFSVQTKKASLLCLQRGKIGLWAGRNRHFSHRRDDAHKAFNSVIQGGAADIVEHQMVRLDQKIGDDETCRMLLQVHDEIIFEIKQELVDYWCPTIIGIMEDVQPSFGVRFKVEAKVWGSK